MCGGRGTAPRRLRAFDFGAEQGRQITRHSSDFSISRLEQVQEREPGRRCGHVERSPVAASHDERRCWSHFPCGTIAEPSCWRRLVVASPTPCHKRAFSWSTCSAPADSAAVRSDPLVYGSSVRVFDFGAEQGRQITRHSSDFSISRLARTRGIHVACMRLGPGGVVGYHQAATHQILAVVEGAGWTRGEGPERTPIAAGSAVYWQPGRRRRRCARRRTRCDRATAA